MKPYQRVLFAAAFAAFFIGTAKWNPVLPKDNGQFQNADPELKKWFESLKNENFVPCCDWQDGARVEDPDWKQEGGQYLIRIGERWFVVPPEAVLKERNRVGFAIVWINQSSGKIVCFLPGSGV